MMNFEERKAEIFRRSEKRIKDRKKVITSLSILGAPTLLCLVLLVLIAPSGLGFGFGTKNQLSTNATKKVVIVDKDGVVEEITYVYVDDTTEPVEGVNPTFAPTVIAPTSTVAPNDGISNSTTHGGNSATGTPAPSKKPSVITIKPTRVETTSNKTTSINNTASKTAPPATSTRSPITTTPSAQHTPPSAAPIDGHRITITAPDGSVRSYLLVENKLIDEETQEETILTDVELETLKELLGLSE